MVAGVACARRPKYNNRSGDRYDIASDAANGRMLKFPTFSVMERKIHKVTIEKAITTIVKEADGLPSESLSSGGILIFIMLNVISEAINTK